MIKIASVDDLKKMVDDLLKGMSENEIKNSLDALINNVDEDDLSFHIMEKWGHYMALSAYKRSCLYCDFCSDLLRNENGDFLECKCTNVKKSKHNNGIFSELQKNCLSYRGKINPL